MASGGCGWMWEVWVDVRGGGPLFLFLFVLWVSLYVLLWFLPLSLIVFLMLLLVLPFLFVLVY